MRSRSIAGLSVVTRGAVSSLEKGSAALAAEAQAGGVPQVEVDPSWPSIPNDWVFTFTGMASTR